MNGIALVTVVVTDYDEAIAFYVNRLGFVLKSDQPLDDGKRWVVVAPAGGSCGVLLAKAVTEAQRAVVGNQTGGRVFLFLETNDLDRDHSRLTSRGVNFIRPPRREAYGKVAVFEDLYGNLWDLIEPRRPDA